MSDFDILAHLRNMHFGEGSSSGGGAGMAPSDGTNEKDTVTAALETNRMPMQIFKSMFGINMENLGSASVTSGLDTEGIAGKNIASVMDQVNSSRGGFLYNLAHSIFIKNREITDHTQGVGGDATGGGGGGSAGGGGTDSSFESYASSSGMGEMFIAAGGGNHFQVQDMPMASLGTLSPQNFGGATAGHGEGFGMA